VTALFGLWCVVTAIELWLIRKWTRNTGGHVSAFKIELGSQVKDKITGYKGMVIGRTEWLYGCRRYTLQAQELKDGKPVEHIACDEDAIEVLEQAEPHVLKETGGPRDDAQRRSDAVR
jgi:hypothetical protein